MLHALRDIHIQLAALYLAELSHSLENYLHERSKSRQAHGEGTSHVSGLLS